MTLRAIFTAAATIGLALLPATVRADTLYSVDGEQLNGTLQAIADGEVQFEAGEETVTLPATDVLRLQLQRARLHDDVQTVADITDPYLKRALELRQEAAAFPSASSITLLDRETYDLTKPGEVQITVRRITQILEQRGEDVASQNVYYFEDTDTPSIDFALTVTPEGRVLHLSDAALKNESVFSSFPAYQRLSRFRFACKEPRPGSILDVQQSVTRKLTPVLEPFYIESVFRDSEPLLEKEVVVRVPAEREGAFAATLRNAESVAQERTVEDGVVTLTFRLAAPQAGVIAEPNMPAWKRFVPILYAGEATSWSDLLGAYREHLASVEALPADGQQKARDLFAEGGVDSVHSFVAREVATAPVPHAAFRPVPHAPGDVLREGLANELDKNFLLCSMLQAAGVDARFALVRGRNQGPLAEEVAALAAFNRSAVYLPKEKRFLSASSDRLDLRAFPGELQGAPALVFGPDDVAPCTTPVAKPKHEHDATYFEGTLDASGTLALDVTYTGSGNAVSGLRDLQTMDDQQLRRVAEQVAAGIHPNAKLESCETHYLEDLTQSPALHLRVTVPGFAATAGDNLLFSLPTVNYTASSVGRPEREYDLQWDHRLLRTVEGVVHLPDGYAPYFRPAKVRHRSDVADYIGRVRVRDGVLRFSDQYTLKVLDAPASRYPSYKECVERQADLARQRVILRRDS
jgi:hypothetical protein